MPTPGSGQVIGAGPSTRFTGTGGRGQLGIRLAWLLGLALVVAELGWATTVLRSQPEPVRAANWSTSAGADGQVVEPDAPAVPDSASGVAGASAGTGSGGTAQDRVLTGPARVAGWAHRLSPQVGIPEVALAAYGSAELTLATERPGCHLSWAAVAGIGSVESDHGRYHGAVLRADGTSQPPIIGIPLDGHGVALIPDSDGGRFDGDTRYDRAVGPMQFLPSTWQRWGADGDGDGRVDPFSLPDAALAAGRYLCSSGRNLRTAPGWTAAVLSYNDSAAYLAEVTARGNSYAARSLGR